MRTQRKFGIVMLVVGVVLFVIGVNASNSLVDQLSDTFFGRFTDATNWYFLGGAAASVLGLVMVVVGGRGKRAVA